MSELMKFVRPLLEILNLVLIPILVLVNNIHKRLTTLEIRQYDRRSITRTRCPIDTGRCPVYSRDRRDDPIPGTPESVG